MNGVGGWCDSDASMCEAFYSIFSIRMFYFVLFPLILKTESSKKCICVVLHLACPTYESRGSGVWDATPIYKMNTHKFLFARTNIRLFHSLEQHIASS